MLHVCPQDHEVSTSIFKLLAEVTMNRSQRLILDVSSLNGTLLFRAASKVVTMYAKERPVDAVKTSDVYAQRFKPISLCLNIARNIIGGRYVILGIFRLYQDRALDELIESVFNMVEQIPLDDILVRFLLMSIVVTLCRLFQN
jgi:hypothetical protein